MTNSAAVYEDSTKALPRVSTHHPEEYAWNFGAFFKK